MSVVWHLFIQSRQIELVLNVVFVDLAVELVAAKSTEPTDPGNLFRTGHVSFLFVNLVSL